MDELSAFKNAPPQLMEREAALMQRASIVFTGGQSLYEAKVGRCANLHAFPSSIDYGHFAQARSYAGADPDDQASIPHPRVGFAGVIDERMNLQLLREVAEARPKLHFVMLGPVVKIDHNTLPQLPNIHYLGGKSYGSLPSYFAKWDAAILPFAHNESTRYISPTKTPEYLAAGLPVVSTSIADVVRPYGEKKLVRIADSAADFSDALDRCLATDRHDAVWKHRVELELSTNSWDLTYQKMLALINAGLQSQQSHKALSVRPNPLPLSVASN
jgi:UDP-galactopyranose mutase